MDIIQYQKNRDENLSQFQKQYDDLKVQYRSHLYDAGNESDPKKQSDLVQQTLSINKEIAKHLRDFLGTSKELNTTTITNLTQDIINYQKEHNDIETSKNKTKTTRGILMQKQTQLQQLQLNFNLFLGFLLAGIFLLVILIFRTSLVQSSSPQVGQGRRSGR
jgi:hypothetical protein